jgi:hypothetical protein
MNVSRASTHASGPTLIGPGRLRATADPSHALGTGIIVALAFLVGFQPLPADPDLWFHLASGERIRHTGHVPRIDPFSFTRTGELWVPHSWLFDVAVAASWHSLGPRATEALFALAFMLTFVLAFDLLIGRGVPPLLAAGVCGALAVLAGNTRGVRPQVLTLLLAMAMLALLVGHQARPRRLTALILGALFLVWAQFHSACVLGLIILLLWVAGRTLDATLRRTLSIARRELGTLALGAVLSAAAILITPHAISLYRYVALTYDIAFLRERVSEWVAPRLWPPAVPDVFLFVLAAMIATALYRSRFRAGLAELLTCAALLALGFTARRHIPLACAGCAPLLACLLRRRDQSRSPSEHHGALPEPPTHAASVRPLVAMCIAAVALLAGFWRFPGPIEYRYASAEPVYGAAALAALGRPLNVFTTYNTGSYVLFAGEGQLRVSADSRADVYGDDVLRQVDRARRGEDWESFFETWAVDAAIVERRDPLATILGGRGDWTLLGSDIDELTFLRRTAQAQGASAGR